MGARSLRFCWLNDFENIAEILAKYASGRHFCDSDIAIAGFARCHFRLPAGTNRSMKSPDGVTVPTWKDAAAPPRHPPPTDGLRADVVVVGAGIAGLSCAYLLAREGKSVVVLDDGPVAAGQSERTSAHLASAIDDRFF